VFSVVRDVSVSTYIEGDWLIPRKPMQVIAAKSFERIGFSTPSERTGRRMHSLTECLQVAAKTRREIVYRPLGLTQICGGRPALSILTGFSGRRTESPRVFALSLSRPKNDQTLIRLCGSPLAITTDLQEE
jgi:hypothetical protein